MQNLLDSILALFNDFAVLTFVGALFQSLAASPKQVLGVWFSCGFPIAMPLVILSEFEWLIWFVRVFGFGCSECVFMAYSQHLFTLWSRI